MVSCLLTSVPGSSSAVRGGIASYALGVKEDVLGVDGALLAADGAVNSQTAAQMAEGARRVLAADIAVSATGIAGPAGAEPGKPVGTVWFGISTEEGTCTEEMRFAGERDAVRRYAAMHALDLLLRTIDQHPA